MTLATALSLALPPVLGSVIGYVTNAIAIRMLFRPLREWRLFGVRVPFTPGIIPRRRGQFAESIGRMVSDELLTEDSVRRQTSSESFVSGVRAGVGDLLEKILEKPLSGVPTDRRAGTPYADLAREALAAVVGRATFRRFVEALVSKALDALGDRRIDELFQTADAQAAEVVGGFIRNWLRDPDRRNNLSSALSDSFSRLLEDNEPIARYLPEDAAGVVLEVVSKFYEPAVRSLLGWLASPGMRTRIESQSRLLLRDILSRLTVIQKFFVTAAQYDRQLESKMPEIVDDALEALTSFFDDQETRSLILSAAERKTMELRSLGVSDIAESLGIDSLSPMIDRFLDLLLSESTEGVIDEVVGTLLEPIGRMKLAEVVASFASMEELGRRLSSAVCDRMLAIFGSEPSSGPGIAALLRSAEIERIGDLVPLDPALRDRLARLLAATAITFIDSRVPSILASLDVRSLVVDKINGLDVEQVEGLLLRVIQRHLKWINVFGAILGFLIGALQIVSRFVL